MKHTNYLLGTALTLILAGCGGGSTSAPIVKVVIPATEHVITYGQSLSLGERAVMDFSTGDLAIPEDANNVGLMFKGGTRPTDLSQVVPFEESTDPVDLGSWNIATPGETPLYGALEAIQGADSAFHLGSAAGRGGTTLVDLSKGTEPYARLLAQIVAGKTTAPGAYSVLAVLWMQGEADTGNAEYGAELTQLFTDIGADVRSITGQSVVQFYICTTADAGIAAQQRQVALSLSNVTIACNDNDFQKSDGLHLTAVASREVGGMFGAAILNNLK